MTQITVQIVSVCCVNGLYNLIKYTLYIFKILVFDARFEENIEIYEITIPQITILVLWKPHIIYLQM